MPFIVRAQLATAAAWSPNPKNPPLYLDFRSATSATSAGEMGRQRAFGLFDQYLGNLRRIMPSPWMSGTRMGWQGYRKFHDVLDSYDIPNSFTIYPGTHTSNVAFRFQDYVLPFFSRNCILLSCVDKYRSRLAGVGSVLADLNLTL